MMSPLFAITFGPLEIAFAVIAGLSLIFIILFLFAKGPAKVSEKPAAKSALVKEDKDAKDTSKVIDPPADEKDVVEEDKGDEEPVPALLVETEDIEEKAPRPKPPFKPKPISNEDDDQIDADDLPKPDLPPVKKATLPALSGKEPVEDKSDDPEMKVEISPFVKKPGKDMPPKPGADNIEDEADQQTIEEEREA